METDTYPVYSVHKNIQVEDLTLCELNDATNTMIMNE